MHGIETWAKAALISVMAILAPTKAMILTMATLVVFDAMTGMMAAVKRKERLTSARARDTVSKLIIYTAAIIITFLAQKFLLEDTIPACSMVTGMIGLAELMSCLENLNEISGTNLLKSVIDKLGSKNK